MSDSIVTENGRLFKEFTRDEWICYAFEFLEARRGLFAATDNESLVGYVDAYKPVYVLPGKKVEGETWYVWFVFPGRGHVEYVVNSPMPGVYVCAQTGDVLEHEPAWVLVLGSVTRIGEKPLLSKDMLR